jgi:hypothetical protein
MWDLLFGKPKKRYYKPKNKRVAKQNEAINKSISALEKSKKSINIKSNEIVTPKIDVWKNQLNKKREFYNYLMEYLLKTLLTGCFLALIVKK